MRKEVKVREDFCKEIDSLSCGFACGPDGWSSDLIKRLKYPIARFLKSIYDKSIEEGRFSNNLKHRNSNNFSKVG